MLTPNRLGLALGSFAAIWHISWLVLVGTGWAQKLINWIFLLHFIDPPFHVREFVLARAVVLVPLSTALAYLMGLLLGSILRGVSHYRSDRMHDAARELRRFVVLALILSASAFVLALLFSRAESRSGRLEHLMDEAEQFLERRNREAP